MTFPWKEQGRCFFHLWPSHLTPIYLEGRSILFCLPSLWTPQPQLTYLSISDLYCLWQFSTKYLLWKGLILKSDHLLQGTEHFFLPLQSHLCGGERQCWEDCCAIPWGSREGSVLHQGEADCKEGREGGKGEIETQETSSLPQLLLLRRKEQKKYISACLLI